MYDERMEESGYTVGSIKKQVHCPKMRFWEEKKKKKIINHATFKFTSILMEKCIIIITNSSTKMVPFSFRI